MYRSARFRLTVAAAFCFGALLLGPGEAGACSFASRLEPYDPNGPFEFHPGPAQSSPTREGDYWEPIPAPVVRVVQVTRGTKKRGVECGDAGTVKLAISLPAGSTYNIKDFAVVFRVLSGRQPDAIFPDVPLVGPKDGGEMTIFLAWLDGAPSHQIPLDLQVDAFFMSGGMHVGKSTVFAVKG